MLICNFSYCGMFLCESTPSSLGVKVTKFITWCRYLPTAHKNARRLSQLMMDFGISHTQFFKFSLNYIIFEDWIFLMLKNEIGSNQIIKKIIGILSVTEKRSQNTRSEETYWSSHLNFRNQLWSECSSLKVLCCPWRKNELLIFSLFQESLF